MTNKTLHTLLGSALAAVVILVGVLVYASQNSHELPAGAVGGMLAENYDPYLRQNGGFNTALQINTSGLLSTTGTFQVGSAGTAQSNQINTTVSLISNATINATTSGYAYFTGLAGLTSSDRIDASFATSSTKNADQWILNGCVASSTAGSGDCRIVNQTGANAVFSAVTTIGSTTVIQAGH